MFFQLTIVAVLALAFLCIGDANLVCNTNIMPSKGALAPVKLGNSSTNIPAIYVTGQTYIWNSASYSEDVNSSACLTVTTSGSAIWYPPGITKQNGIISGTFGIGLQAAMGETLSASNNVSCAGVMAFNENQTFYLTGAIQNIIQKNLYGNSSIYGYMNTILNIYTLQCCDTISGCNQAVAMTVGPFNGDKSRMSISSATLLGSVLLSVLFMKMMISSE
ncbi:hypothetical protein CEUSTIGMA_g8862.t1 [Chlamydomonas eustigma]|uniref:Uncharacterized protein n=1 Tax=Chlamydomonas eustigma TaxID=1157962 RepID=A0A250XET6_9CHLO|nr:hypothetical protein CEUSTIGMA_g8862.t1 [Chlamydomonas eustigma]|eukprot:GAX81432.1 hypothetical protein CEUSTIGMA_g8862.t1 [Chlamydomonas eustigma]